MKIAERFFAVGMSVEVQKGIVDREAYLIDKAQEAFAVSGRNFHTFMQGAAFVRSVSLLHMIVLRHRARRIGVRNIVTA